MDNKMMDIFPRSGIHERRKSIDPRDGMIVYIVIRNNCKLSPTNVCDDIDVIGVFTTRSQAEQYCEKSFGDVCIHESVLNPKRYSSIADLASDKVD